ncbi:MAG: hypothetical protein ABW175_21880 [Bradyrhizobium sp.]
MPFGRIMRLGPVAVLCAATVLLGGCASQIADMPSLAAPADAPGRPKEAGGFLPVHDLPPERAEATMKPAELAKMQSELTAARDRQAVAPQPSGEAKAAKKRVD